MPKQPKVFDPKNLNKPQIRLPTDEPEPLDEKGIPRGDRWLWDWTWWFSVIAGGLAFWFINRR